MNIPQRVDVVIVGGGVMLATILDLLLSSINVLLGLAFGVTSVWIALAAQSYVCLLIAVPFLQRLRDQSGGQLADLWLLPQKEPNELQSLSYVCTQENSAGVSAYLHRFLEDVVADLAEAVGRPLPDVAAGVEEAVAVRREGVDRAGAGVAVELVVAVRERALPDVATVLAARFEVDDWRWAGVPFYRRAGKRLPKRATSTRWKRGH